MAYIIRLKAKITDGERILICIPTFNMNFLTDPFIPFVSINKDLEGNHVFTPFMNDAMRFDTEHEAKQFIGSNGQLEAVPAPGIPIANVITQRRAKK